MTLRRRFTLLLSFVALIPALLPLGGYLHYRLTIPRTEVQEITEAPPFVVQDLHRIIDGTIPAEEIDSRILIIVYNQKLPLYINPLVLQIAEEQGITAPPKPGGDPAESVALLNAISEKNPDQAIGTSMFTYRDKPGFVVFTYFSGNPLRLFIRHPLIIISGGFVLLVLIPLIFSSRFLFSIRRSLSSLEESAGRISSGTLNQPLEIPKDPELKPVFIAFEEMRSQLKEDQEQQARFLMSVSHDLKTPMTSIRGFIEALQDGMIEGEEETTRIYSLIRQKTELLEERISELIETTRISSESWTRSFEEIDAASFITELFNRFRIESEARGHRYRSVIDLPGELRISGDRKMLGRALENLIENAIRYGGAGVEILASAKLADGMLRIAVEDSGEGISADDRSLLFEPFYRGDKGRNSRGLGLGLTSVKTIAEAHGGSVGLIESSLGGAGIYFEVPAEGRRPSTTDPAAIKATPNH